MFRLQVGRDRIGESFAAMTYLLRSRLSPLLGLLVSAWIAASLTLIIAVSGASAAAPGGWPTTCLELNDIVEAHLDRPGNVGIYQRAYGDQAEAHCQNDHRADVQSAFAWALPEITSAPSSEPAPGGWSTTCVGLNDIVESHLNRPDNVGIYHWVFGDGPEAEQACRSDHRDDTRAAFAWVLADAAPPTTESPIKGQPPTAVRALEFGDCAKLNHRTPQLHWHYCRLAGAEAGYDSVVWIDNLPPLDGGGLVLQGYRWNLTGPRSESGIELSDGDSVKVFLWELPLGSYTYTVNAFNAAGDGLPVTLDFVVDTLPADIPQPGHWDPRLRAVAEYLKSALSIFANSVDAMITEGLRAFFGDVGGGRTAFYAPNKHIIVVGTQHSHVRLQGLAPVLAHELWHALNLGPGRGQVITTEGCYQEELSAMRIQAVVWSVMGPPSPHSGLERLHDHIYEHHQKGSLETAVRMAYRQQCSYYGE